MSLEKAVLIPRSPSSVPSVTFQYNPTKYTVAKTTEWEFAKQKGQDVSAVEFVKGQGRTITMELFLDGLETSKDVSADVASLNKMMSVDPSNKGKSGKARPPFVEFHWAASKEQVFPAVIKTMSVAYTMFHSNGTPARATVNLTLQEVADAAKKSGQNPSSLGNSGISSHRVVAGETLDLIAYNELGDSKHWRFIAELNNIHNPFDLRPGMHLTIAPPP